MIPGDLRRGLKSVRESSSFAPLGLDHFPLVPTAYAVGCILSPLRGQKLLALFHSESPKRDLTHTLEAAPFQNEDQKRIFQQPARRCRRLHRSFAAKTFAQNDDAYFGGLSGCALRRLPSDAQPRRVIRKKKTSAAAGPRAQSGYFCGGFWSGGFCSGGFLSSGF